MTDRYPDTPGAKGPDGTSQEAAEAIAPCVSYLRRVAMRALFPSRTLIVAADDDRHLSENIGLEAAQRAAESIGALLATPLPLGSETRSADSGTDFADIALAEVAATVRDRKENPSNPNCANLERRIEMQLGDGFESSRTALDGHFVPIIGAIAYLAEHI